MKMIEESEQFSNREIISGGWRDYLAELSNIVYAFSRKKMLKKYRERPATQKDPMLENEEFSNRIDHLDKKIDEINSEISKIEKFDRDKKTLLMKKVFEAVDILMDNQTEEERESAKSNIQTYCDLLMRDN